MIQSSSVLRDKPSVVNGKKESCIHLSEVYSRSLRASSPDALSETISGLWGFRRAIHWLWFEYHNDMYIYCVLFV